MFGDISTSDISHPQHHDEAGFERIGVHIMSICRIPELLMTQRDGLGINYVLS